VNDAGGPAHAAIRRGGPLLDRFGRQHTYLRVSVTDRCNFRCVYCMPAEGLSWMPKAELLTYEEIGRLAGVFAALGVQKLRLTGGEPTVRADIEALVRAIAAHRGLRDLAMTTNGHNLERLAPRLAAAGLTRVNVSIDSLDPARFARLTRGGELARVLRGIEAARAAGLLPIKLNAVIIGGENDDEVLDLVEYARERAPEVELRFIEYMPFDARWHQSVPSATLRQRISARYPLRPLPREGAAPGPARSYLVEGTALRVGFISALSEHFCATCNRLRLQSDGHLRTCLAHDDTPSLRDLLRAGADDLSLAEAVRAMVMQKPEGHEAQRQGGVPFEGVMTRIGG
jgi:cyclic pyranopterin phosphate synthase